MYLVFDGKERGTFRSATWGRDYNPDLCFTSRNGSGQPLPAIRSVLPDFPHSQHPPVLIGIGIQIPLINSVQRPRWNFSKARWNDYAMDLDKCVRWIPATKDSYQRFVGAVIAIDKKHIPRGYRKEYIPGWNDECNNLYKRFKESGNGRIAEELLKELDGARRNRWNKTVERLDFKHSSRQAWSLLRKLGAARKPTRQGIEVEPELVAEHIIRNSRVNHNLEHTDEIRRQLKILRERVMPNPHFSAPFSAADIHNALRDMKTGKAPGFDGIHPEFLLNAGKNTRRWLSRFCSDILATGKIALL
ncbi:uncharacterized protein LOC120352793 [Nilaparvata lugens]|uniref:uncharacterized protein LOC120352793 n=1 Tax=Nilaparvata lugens TaxID=108931 RepID=UPI00193EC077|nr:uncharacterized protein LOC120352793 [Nilaparvata lugens]